MKGLLRFGIVILLVFVLIFGYISYKKYEVKSAVEDYLKTELGVVEEDITEITPFKSNLPGDKAWLVGVRLKNDPKLYYYYKHEGKILMESYTLDGVEHVVD